VAGRIALAPAKGPLASAAALVEPLRSDMRRSVRRSLGVPGEPPPRSVNEGEAYMAPDGMARRVHGDLAAMVVGGLAALMLQTLHPLAMAGVADHSNYREDPIGRLRRTANFIGTTTFGTVEEAQVAIDRVKSVHRRVHGTAPDGRPYNAGDPDLLTWVHVAEVASFLAGTQRYGPSRLSREDCDRYLEETAPIALALGAEWVPVTVDEMDAYFARMRPTLYAGAQAKEARDFLLRGVAKRPNDRLVHAMIATAAVSVLPDWARTELQIPAIPLVNGLVEDLLVAPMARAFCAAIRWTVTPPAVHPG